MAEENPTRQYEDVTLLCKECSKPFIFTVKEQKFYVKQGFEHVPTRCPACRQTARDKRDKGRAYYPIKCKVTGKVGRLPFEPDNPDDVYSEEAFYTVFNEKGRLVDPLTEPDKTHLIEEERARRLAAEEAASTKTK